MAHTDAQSAELAKIRTMRDVFDYCNKHGLCSVAQVLDEHKGGHVPSVSVCSDTTNIYRHIRAHWRANRGRA